MAHGICDTHGRSAPAIAGPSDVETNGDVIRLFGFMVSGRAREG